MAVLWTDGVSAVSAANLNKLMGGDSSGNYQMLSYRIYWNGASFTVSTSYGTKVSGSLVTATWDAVDYKLNIALGGIVNPFAGTPSIVCSPEAVSAYSATTAGGLNYLVQGTATGPTAAYVRFIDPATMTLVTATGSRMAFYVTFIGQTG